MSVVIKGMEMPTSCGECRLSVDDGCVPQNQWLNEEGTNKRLDNCPLIELPPHGRLIDADALVKSIKDQIELIKQFHNDDLDMIAQMIEVGYMQEIATAPTILEAEMEE